MMNIRYLLVTGCSIALAAVGCASSEGSGEETTPAAAEGAPATIEPTSGAETTSLPAPATTPAPASGAETTTTPAASPAQPEAPKQPMAGTMITHKVKDFATWKTAFDAHADARKQAGISGHSVLQDPTNEKLVSVWLVGADAAQLKAFTTDKALQEKMKAAGVIGKPTVATMTLIDQKMDPAKTNLSSAVVKANVKDFAAFKAAFDTTAQARTDAGLVGYGLAQDVDDATIAYVYLQSDDVAKIKAYVDSKDTKKAWKDAGVKGAGKTSYFKEGESKTYSN